MLERFVAEAEELSDWFALLFGRTTSTTSHIMMRLLTRLIALGNTSYLPLGNACQEDLQVVDLLENVLDKLDLGDISLGLENAVKRICGRCIC